ncbi:hypothetical protein [Coleofasciculus sp.]|uniref:hypothetical protein n=1 Tax=Coleofasciculus sp. TaxID=3100458 RepID=UPI0039F93932
MAGAARFPTPVEWQPRLYLLLFAKEFNYLARAATGNRKTRRGRDWSENDGAESQPLQREAVGSGKSP